MTFNKNGIDKVLSSTDRLEVIMRSRPSCVSTFVLSLTTSNSESHKSNRLCVTVESLQHSHSTDRIHRFFDGFRDFKGCYSTVRQSRMKNGRVVAVKAIDPHWMQEGDIISVRRQIFFRIPLSKKCD